MSKALKELAGVTDAKVDVGSAVVTYEPGQVSEEMIKGAVADAGYQVVDVTA